ncbi:CBASS oligonucleotide cyclase [Actinomycetospora flava]|uniref:CBASS oligonucleotide cyclase n=1 Tax=Actinomycetospora flava TaxID=3129232 RepID=A0ABU8M350_9PSEU
MGGSGGGSNYADRRPAEELRQETQRDIQSAELLANANSFLNEQLVEINDRDVETINARLDDIEGAISEVVEDIDRLVFGGSVSKHTYVDGLSDVDSLVLLNATEGMPTESPQQFREAFAQIIRNAALPGVADVYVGNLAVTLSYSDGTEIQLLPALRTAPDGDLRISSSNGERWRSIHPRRFAEQLTALNQRNGNRLVPTIKLAKAIVATLPEGRRPSGYHMEALAVEAFSSYSGPLNYTSMLQHFFSTAATRVLTPITDRTGQSSQVDESLGSANSPERARVADDLNRIARRMKNSTNVGQWRDLLDE